MERLPDFLIVGAVKSGTTSLFEYLRQHPEVFGPAMKEPSYFAKDVPSRVSDLSSYLDLFANAVERRAGEASVAYLFDPTAAAEIRKTLGPSTKIIIMLRNPVDMMYSLWGHMTRVGGETLGFQEAIEAEESRLADPSFVARAHFWVPNIAYRRRATYAPQVGRFLELFPRENIHLVIYEEFFANTAEGFGAVCRFLGVSSAFVPRFARHNPAGTVRSRLLRSALTEQFRAKSVYKRVVPLGIRQGVRDIIERLNRRTRPLPPMTSAQRERLTALFTDDVRQLENLIGRSLREIWQI